MLTSSKFLRASFIDFLKTETTSVILCNLKFLLHSICSQRHTLQIVSVGFFWLKFPLTQILWLCNGPPRLSMVFPTATWCRATALAGEGGIPGFSPPGPPSLPQLWGSHSDPALCYLPGVLLGSGDPLQGRI